MAHTYLLFDFGSDEEKAQQARHKLESWKQAFRLDKKLLYKLDRGESEAAESADSSAQSDESATPAKSSKSASKSAKASKSAPKAKAKSKSKSSEEESAAPSSNGQVNLVVRLYFSGHEKLTEQRLLDRIPNEEPFKDASPQIVRQGEPQFDELVQQFESLE
jgi:hypothetical protein